MSFTADYSLAQIKAMQEDATRRVREMNRRSKSTLNPLNNNTERPQGSERPAKKTITDSPTTAHKTESNSHGLFGNPLNFLNSLDLKKLISGGDQSLLLLLVLILLNDDNSDDFLIYALIYIML